VDIGRTLRVATAPAWRAWLRAHHRRTPEVWLVFYAKSTGRAGIAYDDAVDEALCWGWIDSVVKRMPGEEGARAQRFTPRRPGAPISELNKARVRRLVAQRRMTKAGLAALAHVPDLLQPPPLRIAPDVRRALRQDPQAWRHFLAFPEEYRRVRIGWVEAGRGRPQFEQRLRHLVRMTKRGRRFGMGGMRG
jgi:uncharacterized protein YdeI (YjbR/CyaY-like superfamily)